MSGNKISELDDAATDRHSTTFINVLHNYLSNQANMVSALSFETPIEQPRSDVERWLRERRGGEM